MPLQQKRVAQGCIVCVPNRGIMTQANLNVIVHYVTLKVFMLFHYVCVFLAPMNATVMPLALFPFYFEKSSLEFGILLPHSRVAQITE